ncbi:MAG: histidine kinase dimerization/phospho-acceptor domain-containing protein, partial [Phycisphaerae bacterium]
MGDFLSNSPWWAAAGMGAAVVLAFWMWRLAQRRRQTAAIMAVIQDLLKEPGEGRDARAGTWGHYSGRRADPTAPGPLGELAQAINQLAGNVERRQVQAEQDQANQVALLQHIADVAIITDAEQRVILANPAAERLLDRPASALLGQSLPALLPPRELLDLMATSVVSELPVQAEFRLAGPRRTMQCQATVTALYTDQRFRGTLIFIRDLTDITAAFQMKTEFAANASHELRTPLASIRAAVETIQESWGELLEDPRGPSGDMVKRCVEIIGGHALRLHMLVQDLLDLSRTEDARGVVRKDRVDLTRVCDMVMSMYVALAAEKKVQLRVELDPDAHTLRGDERLLTLVLKNLVDNSLKFTPAGGSICIHAHTRPVPPAPSALPAIPAAPALSAIAPAPAGTPVSPASVSATT